MRIETEEQYQFYHNRRKSLDAHKHGTSERKEWLEIDKIINAFEEEEKLDTTKVFVIVHNKGDYQYQHSGNTRVSAVVTSRSKAKELITAFDKKKSEEKNMYGSYTSFDFMVSSPMRIDQPIQIQP